MFLHVSVILFPGGWLAETPQADTLSPWADTPQADTLWVDTPWQTPPGQTPPRQTPPGQTPPHPERRPLQRTVRILLECILFVTFSSKLNRTFINSKHGEFFFEKFVINIDLILSLVPNDFHALNFYISWIISNISRNFESYKIYNLSVR